MVRTGLVPSQRCIRTRDLASSLFLSPPFDLGAGLERRRFLLGEGEEETGVLPAEKLWRGACLEERAKPASGISALTKEASLLGITSQHKWFPFAKVMGVRGTTLLSLLRRIQ